MRAIRTVLIVWAIAMCQAAFAENAMELVVEGIYYQGDGDSSLHLIFEHWPATIEAYVAPIGSVMKSEESIVFSLSSTPRTHEKLRLGILAEIDKPADESLHRPNERDDRLYLYARSESRWGTAKLLYPLAVSNNGYRWYPRLELRDLNLGLVDVDRWSLSLIGDAYYSQDPELGFDYNYGFRIDYQEAWLSATTDYISIGWSATTTQY